MKKYGLILAGIMFVISANSATATNNNTVVFNTNYSYNNTINFFERGIEFFVFINGEFDFNTSNNFRRGVRIERGFNGEIRRVGNVFINYDRFGNVKRIGTVFINYFRGRVTRVGDLRVRYDNWGTPLFYGNVHSFYYDNGIRFSINFGRIYNYNDAFFNHRNFNRNYTRFREDRDFYYYKANPTTKIGKGNAIVKRRKPANVVNNKDFRNNKDNRYRKANRTQKREVSSRNIDKSNRSLNRERHSNSKRALRKQNK